MKNKTYNQLDLIRDQGDRQLDLTGRVNMNKTKSIGFQNERLKRLEKEIIKKNKKRLETRIRVKIKRVILMSLFTQKRIMLPTILVNTHIY